MVAANGIWKRPNHHKPGSLTLFERLNKSPSPLNQYLIPVIIEEKKANTLFLFIQFRKSIPIAWLYPNHSCLRIKGILAIPDRLFTSFRIRGKLRAGKLYQAHFYGKNTQYHPNYIAIDAL